MNPTVEEKRDISPESSPPRLSRTVIALGVVSLFTDMASEMVYTQIPLFLTLVLGERKAIVGLIEGCAESTSSLLRLVSGVLSDRSGQRKPLTLLGYGLGAISKPLMALAYSWPIVFLLRFMDRTGKGLRTAPRDALITESTPQTVRGRAFGLHRAMDTMGAVIGPLLGAWLLSRLVGYPSDVKGMALKYQMLFLFAGIPGALAVLTLLLVVKEPRSHRDSALSTSSVREQRLFPRWRDLQPAYRHFLLITLLFNLGNSSDAFLILRAQSLHFDPTEILWLYAAFNLVEAILGYSAGILSDRVGRRPLIIMGYFVFALVYAGFAFAQTKTAIWGLFLLYGGYYTLTQGVQRAYASDLSDPIQKAAQIGAFHTVVGIALLPASLIAGLLFDWHASAPFLLGALLAIISALLMMMQSRSPQ